MRHIGIVGAGPAGLSAAWYLRKRGFQRLTVLERDTVPGGKCRTFTYRGRPYELGAVMGTRGYHATLDLMEQVGEAPVSFGKSRRDRPTGQSFLERGYVPMTQVFPGYFSYREVLKLLVQIQRYYRLNRRYRKLHSPGLSDVPGTLHNDFSSWVDTHGMQTFAKMIEIPCTAFGYGYLASVPAAYVLKYMEPSMVLSLLFQKRFFKWGGGAQRLWENVARGFEIRFGTKILSVSRGSSVTVSTDAGEFRFDDLILAAPLDEALDYLDAREPEAELFGKIQYTTYYVFACEVKGLNIPSGFIPANLSPKRRGHLMIWSRPWRDADLYLLYAQAQDGWDDRDVLDRIKTDMEGIGARIVRIVQSKKWKYFPHVSVDDLKSGFYERLERMQGQFRTFYAGEVMSFSTIEHSVRYSRYLVDRYFPAGQAISSQANQMG